MLTTNLVEETKQLLVGVRRNVMQIAANLYQIRESGEFEGKFGEYAEETFGLSASTTSKWVSAFEGWVINAGVSQEQIAPIDPEKLYNFLPLLKGKDPEQALAEVSTWSRSDIKAEKQEKTPCEHLNVRNCCTDCWSVV